MLYTAGSSRILTAPPPDWLPGAVLCQELEGTNEKALRFLDYMATLLAGRPTYAALYHQAIAGIQQMQREER